MVSFRYKDQPHVHIRANVIHQVALAEFEDEPLETEQTDAQKSEFTDSAGIFKDHLFQHFHPSRAL
jgi:hypothetical protein